jgi:hypothetical protein
MYMFYNVTKAESNTSIGNYSSLLVFVQVWLVRYRHIHHYTKWRHTLHYIEWRSDRRST